MADRKPKTPGPETDLLRAQAAVQAGEMRARIEARRAEVQARRQKALEETIAITESPEVRKAVRDKKHLQRLDAANKSARERLDRIGRK